MSIDMTPHPSTGSTNIAMKHVYCILYTIWLVVSTPLKNISQLGLLFPIYGKMFQTINQMMSDEGFHHFDFDKHTMSCSKVTIRLVKDTVGI